MPTVTVQFAQAVRQALAEVGLGEVRVTSIPWGVV